jgi:hypothetical protein
MTGSNGTADGDCADGVGDCDSSHGALAGVAMAGDPDVRAEGEAEARVRAEPHAHNKITAIAATAFMTA